MSAEGARTDGGQRDEAEVSGVEQWPFLPLSEEVSAAYYVADDQEEAQPYGNGLDGLFFLIIRGVAVFVKINIVRVNLSEHGESHRRHNPRRWSALIRTRWGRYLTIREYSLSIDLLFNTFVTTAASRMCERVQMCVCVC